MKTENNTHEYYVSLETAKMLKEAGFDWECRKIYYCYHEDGDTWELEDNYKNYKSILKLDHCLLTPTLEVAQRWLREVKNVDVFAYRNEPKDKFESIVSFNKEWSTTGMCINTYEEALETAIKKALETILEKGK